MPSKKDHVLAGMVWIMGITMLFGGMILIFHGEAFQEFNELTKWILVLIWGIIDVLIVALAFRLFSK